MNILNELANFIDTILHSLGVYGPLLGCALIVIESIIPILPLSAFITLNFYAFGTILGFIISLIFTVLGCSLSFFIFRKGFSNKFTEKIKNKKVIETLMEKINTLKFTHLVMIIAMPFTPAFAVNIVAGLSTMSYKKFLIAIIIGKVFMVYFWGFVGTSLLQSLKNPKQLIIVGIMVGIAYIISTIVNKKFDLDKEK